MIKHRAWHKHVAYARKLTGSEPRAVLWITSLKLNDSRRRPRVLVLGHQRVYLLREHSPGRATGGFEVKKQAHLFRLLRFGLVDAATKAEPGKPRSSVVELAFASHGSSKAFVVRYINDNIGVELLHELRCAVMEVSYCFPVRELPYIPPQTAAGLAAPAAPWQQGESTLVARSFVSALATRDWGHPMVLQALVVRVDLLKILGLYIALRR